VAEEQTEGRGRLGRSWHAPPRTSVLVSVMLEPTVPSPRLPELSLVAGQAVAAAIAEQTGLAPTIKHPNDVLVDGRKVAGILAESSEGLLVLGIGINANQTEEELPSETQAPPSSLRAEAGRVVDRPSLLAAILVELERTYAAWVVSATATSG
jgi:BirA family biotin operon repressor/biotin-[acetyl-CoA-carboxylase] ligase